MHLDDIRSVLKNNSPWQVLVAELDNGEQLMITHPESIAFLPPDEPEAASHFLYFLPGSGGIQSWAAHRILAIKEYV